MTREGYIGINIGVGEDYHHGGAFITEDVTPLQPNEWYKLRVEADFGSKKYVSYTVEGPGINKTWDLSQYHLPIMFSGMPLGPVLAFYPTAYKTAPLFNIFYVGIGIIAIMVISAVIVFAVYKIRRWMRRR